MGFERIDYLTIEAEEASGLSGEPETLKASTSNSVARSTSGLTVLTLLSPITGLAVEIALAWRFGSSATMDAYRISSVIVWVGWQLLMVLPNIIVPVFTEIAASGKETEARRLAFSLGNAFAVPAIMLAVLVSWWPGLALKFLAPGLTGESARITTYFVRWTIFTVVPLSWCGAVTGILYAKKIFWLPTACSSIGNITMAALLLALPATGSVLVVGILLSTAATATLYLIRIIPLVHVGGVGELVAFDFGHSDVRKALRLSAPLLGMMALQSWWTILVNRVLSRLPNGSLASFVYAFKMGQLASIVPTCFTLVMFPRLAQSWQDAKGEGLMKVGTKALRMSLFVTVPLVVVCFTFRDLLIHLAFQRGAFTGVITTATSGLFGLVVIGVPAGIILDCLWKIFYASRRMWLPTCVQIVALCILTFATSALATSFGASGVALASTLLPSSIALTLLVVLARVEPSFELTKLTIFGIEVVATSLLAVSAGAIVKQVIEKMLGLGEFALCLEILVGISVTFLCYSTASIILRLPEALQIQSVVRANCKSIRDGLAKSPLFRESSL